MTATIRLQPSGHRFTVEPGETLLEGALRSGLNVNYHCSNGSCGECAARLVSGQLGEVARHDYRLSEQDKANGGFLLCRATAGSDLVIETLEARGVEDIPLQEVVTQVSSIERPVDDVLVLQLRTPRSQTLRFLAGQHVTLRLGELEPRNKSIASCPCNGMVLQFHVWKVEGDPFSEYVFGNLKSREKVQVQGPYGNFVLDEESTRPIIFIAYETGFSPIKSLIEHAISLDLGQPVRLYWVMRNEQDHYMANFCRSWEEALDDFRFIRLSGVGGGVTQPGDSGLSAPEQAMLKAAGRVVEDIPDLSGFDVYVNGAESMLEATRSLLLDHGMRQDRLFVDRIQRF